MPMETRTTPLPIIEATMSTLSVIGDEQVKHITHRIQATLQAEMETYKQIAYQTAASAVAAHTQDMITQLKKEMESHEAWMNTLQTKHDGFRDTTNKNLRELGNKLIANTAAIDANVAVLKADVAKMFEKLNAGWEITQQEMATVNHAFSLLPKIYSDQIAVLQLPVFERLREVKQHQATLEDVVRSSMKEREEQREEDMKIVLHMMKHLGKKELVPPMDETGNNAARLFLEQVLI